MERLFGKWGLWVLIILVEISGYNSCFEEERMGLLDVKAFFKSSIGLIKFEGNLDLLPRPTWIDADNLLPTWIDGRESESCCDWERVTCNHSTGHVVELALDNIQDLYFDDYNYWSFKFEELQNHNMTRLINASLFLPFEELQSLNLSFNLFGGWFENEGFERLSVLRKLEVLSLSFNGFNNSILSSLSVLTSLKRLNLQANELNGSFPPNELAHLENLEMLDLSRNGLANTSTKQGCDSLSRLKKLQTLSLGYNNFNQSIILCLSALTSLTNLNLERNLLGGFFPIEELSVLKNLKVLNLGFNDLKYSPKAEGCDSLSRLKKLQTLSLSVNKFNKSIILCLSALTSLTDLNLESNELGGFFHIEELSVLKNLKVLNLGFNALEYSPKAEDSKTLSKLTMLRHLDLSGNSFNNSIILSLLGAALPSLKFLSLASNQMKGQLHDQGLASFHHLQVLDLSYNGLVGSIPPSIGALSSLKALSLASNQLNGSLPANQGLCELKELRELDLSSNSFEGIIPPCLNSLTNLRLLDFSHNRFGGLFSFSLLANHSNLEVVKFISDNEQFEIETQDSDKDWVPMFQLKILVLSNCNLNHDIPNFLLHQHELRVIDLSHNSLQGSFPNWLIDNNTKLESLFLRNNSFTGQFLPPTYRNVHTSWIDVSGNSLSGQIQKNIGEMLPYITYLNLSRNTFEGTIPISFGNMSALDQLDLSFNKLSGEVPYEVVAGCTRLSILNLSANRFRGKIFSTHFNLASLRVLHLENNCFTGTLSDVIFKSSELYVLDVGNNCMSGEIPSGIGNLTSLITLILRNNSFKGRFPFEHVPLYTSFLDLSHNSFLGSLPSCSNLNNVEHMHLQGNKFTGSIPKCFVNSSYLLTLDMRDNNLSGIIPPSVGALSNLKVLLLGGNKFFGLIPNHLCQLSEIGIMDLSRNSFRGSIPNCFHNIRFGKIYNTDFTSVQAAVFDMSRLSFYNYGSVLQRYDNIHDNAAVEYSEQEQVEFVTKHGSSSYKGGILNLMSGLDLSCNNITGEIPPELGKLNSILALNLSHNYLTGPIPNTFSDLTHIESLDLSYNNLSGVIPSELIDLNFLELFSVAHNNLSGRIPDMKAQFGTFEANSYEGNPFLCGQMIEKTCTPVVDSPYVPPANLDESDGKWYEIDPVVFSSSFSATYVMILLGFAAILYINPYWRRRWFYFIEELIYSFYYFVCDLFSRRSGVLCFCLCFMKNK